MQKSTTRFRITGLLTGLLLAQFSLAQTVHKPKTVLITGAASGIGQAAAMAFVGRGYTTYAMDRGFDRFMLRQFKVSTQKGQSVYND